MEDKEYLFKRELASAKSLRWLANMFPDIVGESEEDKMCRAIHLYTTRGAEVIESLVSRLDEAEELERSIVSAAKTGSSICSVCANRRGCETCNPCHFKQDNTLVEEPK